MVRHRRAYSVKQVGSLAFYSIVSSLSLARVRTLYYNLCDWQHSKISPNTRQSLFINVDRWRNGTKYIKHIANARAAQSSAFYPRCWAINNCRRWPAPLSSPSAQYKMKTHYFFLSVGEHAPEIIIKNPIRIRREPILRPALLRRAQRGVFSFIVLAHINK